MKIVSMVERDGKKWSIHVPDVKAKTITPILQANINSRPRLMTHEAAIYRKARLYFVSPESGNPRMREYACGDVTKIRLRVAALW
jgi:hypothetical protein